MCGQKECRKKSLNSQKHALSLKNTNYVSREIRSNNLKSRKEKKQLEVY